MAAVLFFAFGGWGNQDLAFYVNYRDHSGPVNGSGVMDWRFVDGSKERGRVRVTIVDGVGVTSLPVAWQKVEVTQALLTTVAGEISSRTRYGDEELTPIAHDLQFELAEAAMPAIRELDDGRGLDRPLKHRRRGILLCVTSACTAAHSHPHAASSAARSHRSPCSRRSSAR